MASSASVALSTAAGLESQELLSPRQREGPEAPAGPSSLGETAWRGWGLAEGEGELLRLVMLASLRWRVRADLGSRSSWEREINECRCAAILLMMLRATLFSMGFAGLSLPPK